MRILLELQPNSSDVTQNSEVTEFTPTFASLRSKDSLRMDMTGKNVRSKAIKKEKEAK